METLIQGNSKQRNKKYFYCNSCGWAGTATSEEYLYWINEFEEGFYIKCPCCSTEINSLSETSQIYTELLKIELAAKALN